MNTQAVSEPGGGPLTRLAPHDLLSEESLLASMMVDDAAFEQVEQALQPEVLLPADFFREKHGLIWAAMLDLRARSQPLSPTFVARQLQKQGQLEAIGGAAYLTALTTELPTAVGVEYYAQNVKRDAAWRAVLSAAGKIANVAYEGPELFDQAFEHCVKLLLSAGLKTQGPRTARTAAEVERSAGLKRMARLLNPDLLGGIAFGFRNLDTTLGGMAPGRVYTLAGPPSHGKSLLALTLAVRAAEGQQIGHVVQPPAPVLYVTTEMDGEQLADRAVLCHANIAMQEILDTGRELSAEEMEAEQQASTWFAALPLLFEDQPPWSWPSLRTRIAAYVKTGCRLVVIDHIDHLTMPGAKSGDEFRTSAQISAEIKALARQLQIPILVVSPLNRYINHRDGNMPQLSDLSRAGAKEYDSDVVMVVETPALRDPTLDPADPLHHELRLYVLKNRSGETRNLRFYLDRSRGLIAELTGRTP